MRRADGGEGVAVGWMFVRAAWLAGRRLGAEAGRRPGGCESEGSGLRWGEVDWEGVLWEAAATKPNRKEGRKSNVATAMLGVVLRVPI